MPGEPDRLEFDGLVATCRVSGGVNGESLRTVSTGGKTRVKPVPDVKFCLVFQCEPLSVPVMRRVLGDTLRGLGVDEESVYDILLAATEACTNVLIHGGRQVPGYAVMTSLGAVGCQVEVADEGVGVGPREARGAASHPAGDARSPSCPSRAGAWRSCAPASTTSRWTAGPAAGRS